jgi:cell division septal protein FtsQ
VNSPQQPAEKTRSDRVSTNAIVLMIIIVVSIALLAVFANIQRLRHSHIETVVVVPATSITPQPH